MADINNDMELLLAFGQGEQRAVQTVYNRYQPILIKWIVGKGGAVVDAEDAFQEALLVLFRKAREPEFCLTCRLSTYLFAICKNLWLKRLNDNKGFTFHDSLEAFNESEEIEADLEQFFKQEKRLEALEAALEELGPPCRELIKQFYLEGKTMQEIAKSECYANTDSAKTQKYKCLNRLKKLFFKSKIYKP